MYTVLCIIVLFVVVTIVFWTIMSFVVAAMFAFFGLIVAVLGIALFAYLVMRRKRAAALGRGRVETDT